MPSEGLKRFHEQMIEHAKSAIREVPVEERQICGMTLTVKKEDLKEAKEVIRHFMDRFSSRVDQKLGEQVYQLNVQFFPLTKNGRNGNGRTSK